MRLGGGRGGEGRGLGHGGVLREGGKVEVDEV